MTLTLVLAVAIGLVLGLLGGGGSVLTVPMLVYVLHVEPKLAIVTSFVVVGLSSLLALLAHARRGTVCWKSGFFFGSAGMVGAYGGAHLAGHFSSTALMSLFGGICLVTGVLMLGRGQRPLQAAYALRIKLCPLRVPYLPVLFDGFWVGVVTGMVGVGGGFLIVPALTLLVGLPMQGAIGTSLLIIVMNAVAGLSGYSQFVALDMNLTLVVGAGTLSGSMIGSLASARINPLILRQLFAVLVIAVALYTLSQSLHSQDMQFLLDFWRVPMHIVFTLAGLVLILVLVRLSRWIHKPRFLDLHPAAK